MVQLKLIWNKICVAFITMIIKLNEKFNELLERYRDMVANTDVVVEDNPEDSEEETTDNGTDVPTPQENV
jgi:hypothetical protein